MRMVGKGSGRRAGRNCEETQRERDVGEDRIGIWEGKPEVKRDGKS
jgi:hypothetical protein